MGPKFNGPGTNASSAYLSPDGKILFFSSTRKANLKSTDNSRLTRSEIWDIHTRCGMGSSDIWWVDASVLDGYDN